MDIVCVFCGRDLALQRLQARSIARYFERPGLGRVIYVWNDTVEMPADLRGELAACLDGIDFELLSAAELGVSRAAIEVDGWTTQQAAKLLAAGVSGAEHCLVLDAKNHFVWPCSVRDFVTQDGRGIACLQDIGNSEFFRHCLGYFGDRREIGACRGALNVTPFLLRSAVVRRMLATIEQRERRTLAEIFLAHQHKLTEFMAYQAYALKEGIEPSELFQEAATNIAEHVWGPTVQEAGEFERCLTRLQGAQTKVLGLHWMACCLLSERQRESLCTFWVSRGLMDSAEEGQRAIASVTNGLRDGDRRFLDKSLRPR